MAEDFDFSGSVKLHVASGDDIVRSGGYFTFGYGYACISSYIFFA